jgi:hypothetical protein
MADTEITDEELDTIETQSLNGIGAKASTVLRLVAALRSAWEENAALRDGAPIPTVLSVVCAACGEPVAQPLARESELRAEWERERTQNRVPYSECSLCHVPREREICDHLVDLGDGRIIIKRSTWERLVTDRLAYREMVRREEE